MDELDKIKPELDGTLKAKKKKKKKTADRGIETMFRLTSKNHFTLSAIADNKASTLISISALIISIIFFVFGSSKEKFSTTIIFSSLAL